MRQKDQNYILTDKDGAILYEQKAESLSGCLEDAVRKGTNLKGLYIENEHIGPSNSSGEIILDGMKAPGAVFKNVVFKNVSVRQANLDGADISSLKAINSDFRATKLDKTKAVGEKKALNAVKCNLYETNVGDVKNNITNYGDSLKPVEKEMWFAETMDIQKQGTLRLHRCEMEPQTANKLKERGAKITKPQTLGTNNSLFAGKLLHTR